MDGGRFAFLKTHQCCEVVFTPSPSHLLIKKPHTRFSTRKNGGWINERGFKFSTQNLLMPSMKPCQRWTHPIFIYIYSVLLYHIINNSKAIGRVKRKGKSISHLPSHHWGHLQCTVPLSFPLKARTLRNRTEKDRGTVSAKNDWEFPYHKMFTTLKFQWIPHRHNIVYHKMMQWCTNKHSIHLILLC